MYHIFDLRKDYNRRYWRRIIAIRFNEKQRLFRLEVSRRLVYLAFAVSKDAENAIRQHVYKNAAATFHEDWPY